MITGELNSNSVVRSLSLIRALGVKYGANYEVIVTTIDPNRKPHAAPMGIRIVNDNLFFMRSYGETRTLNNLRAVCQGFLNVVNDVELFFHCLFNPSKLSFDWSMDYPIIKGASAWAHFKLVEIVEKEDYYEITCSLLGVRARRVRPRPLCRAESSLLESLIHYTRIKHYERLGRDDLVSKLRSLALHHLDIVERTGWSKLKALAKALRKELT